ncbi:MAG: peptide-methionine (S)-S-oxide reductase MsrA [Candidatus Magasanikbacteria bacterium]|jgi:methionine-S-sulfoxide reductase|nr:peptide-methionine (S)-S-oxide reductase MsrA [Candidatus Magasanikbacteria bacterium]MBT4314507.1 peptide-methionine (S)-S-oxide reductase MsrA [Candidatus Magasanikbacteria bacterium]MBT4547287.1 peptide-methionine (S)-S-oxide reductase MsrA [Candidatus Magasanikbacteria bacterium]MBT6818944.1 peptide-methionine (S)-S-oxide reductase MsrA [Candidatus Magasanikbacteria bacterium]
MKNKGVSTSYYHRSLGHKKTRLSSSFHDSHSLDNKTIVLGGGCFWCTEATFLLLPGVTKVEPGYAGGDVPDPTYEQVSAGDTGHAEVIRVEYDSKKTDLDNIFELFFTVHDPTTLDRQGADVGTQYRSIVLYEDEGQRQSTEDYIAKIQDNYKDKIVTEIKKLDKFYLAEDYHKNYFEKNPNAGYCRVVIAPKVEKAKKIINK